MDDPKLYDRACIALGWFSMYSQWMKLLFTVWVTFHLFCFGVLHKNLKKFEVLYVVTSLILQGRIQEIWKGGGGGSDMKINRGRVREGDVSFWPPMGSRS